MGVSVRGLSDRHLHSACPRCGFATRFKQWPIKCACSNAQRQKVRAAPDAHVLEIWAEQEAKNAELRKLDFSHILSLQVGARYVAGRPGARRGDDSTGNQRAHRPIS